MKSEMDLKHTGFLGLIGSLRDDFVDMIKKEIDLLKTELSEKAAAKGRQGGMIAAGGMIAFTGLIFELTGVCFLIAFGLQKTGLSLVMATWIAFLGFGLIVALSGYLLMKSALRKLAEISVAPTETLTTIKEIRHPDTMNVMPESAKTDGFGKTQAAKIAAERKIEEVQADAEAIRERLKPRNVARAGRDCVARHPIETAIATAATVGLGLLMRRRRQRRIQIAI